jgi:hypothetical protein
MNDAAYAQLPDVVDDEDANRLIKATLAYTAAKQGACDDTFDPREGCSVLVSYDPDGNPKFRVGVWQDPDLLTTCGFPVACQEDNSTKGA